MGTADSL